MSVMETVRRKYKMAIGRTDKTDKSTSDSNGSPSYEDLKSQFPDCQSHDFPVVIEMLRIQEMRSRGIVPDHYSATTKCRRCGPVPIFEGCPPEVGGCPWCFNRLKGLPIPRAPLCEEYDDE